MTKIFAGTRPTRCGTFPVFLGKLVVNLRSFDVFAAPTESDFRVWRAIEEEVFAQNDF